MDRGGRSYTPTRATHTSYTVVSIKVALELFLAMFLDLYLTDNLCLMKVALDDVTENNGCLHFVPGSHK